jgi:nicotinamidase/pyrazinamidase
LANVILVIDMLKGFLEEGNPLYCGAAARGIIPAVKKLLLAETKKGTNIIYLCDAHEAQDSEFQMFPPHCIKGTPECEIIPELAGIPGEVMLKTRYSGFYGTDLEKRLAELKPEKITVVGVCTDICVQHTVSEARNRDYAVEVPADGVASFDEKAHRAALEHMEKILGAKITRPTATIEHHPFFVLPEKVMSGETADIYFARTLEILRRENINPVAVFSAV